MPTKKAFKWAMKTPLAVVKCPCCGEKFAAGIEFQVNTKPKVWKTSTLKAKDGKEG